MRKLLVLVLLIFVSCQATKKTTNFSLSSKYITFDKVRLHFVSTTIGEISLKGYISLVRDSLICFKFFGPFSYEVVSGVYNTNFSLFDNYNKHDYSDVLSLITQRSGLILDRKMVEFMLTSDIPGFISELNNLNHKNFRIEKIDKKSLTEIMIFNDIRNSSLNLRFSKKNNLLSKLSIIYKDNNDHWEIDLNIFDISNNPKKCNFKF